MVGATPLRPVGLLGALENFRAGQVDVRAAVIIAIGLFVGAYFGARVGTSLDPAIAQRAFGIFLLIVGACFTLFA